MRPTDVLMDEHRVIERVLDCLETLVLRCRSEQRLDAAAARTAIDFFRTFADRCHHAKEENQLFPMLESRGFPSDHGPVAVMCAEHDQGRRLIAEMDAAVDAAGDGDGASCETFRNSALAYVRMLRDHIAKEDHCLFPMADGRLTAPDQDELQRRFVRAEEEIGADVSDRYRRIATELEDRLGVRVGATGHAGACEEPRP